MFRNPSPFCAPKLNPLVLWLFHQAMPLIRSLMLEGMTIDIPRDDLNRLKSTRGKRTLLLPNHPTEDDPFVLFELSRQMGEPFNFVAARETFDWNYGLRGRLFQSMGVYSIIRGAVDRESFKQTRQCLSEGLRRLVIFIEGEISYENDTVFPFETGVVHLAFKAQDDLRKVNPQAVENEGVNLVPVAIRYRYKPGVEVALVESVNLLERELSIEAGARSLIARIRTVGEAVLKSQEKRLNIAHDKKQGPISLQARIDTVKERLLERMEKTLNLSPAPNMLTLDRIRVIRNKMDQMVHQYERSGHGSDQQNEYESRLMKQDRPVFQEFYIELDRLLNFLTLREGYMTENSSPERLAEVIRRLEREVFGKARLKYPRVAKVRLGEIHCLSEHTDAYEADHKKAAASLAAELEDEMRALLATL